MKDEGVVWCHFVRLQEVLLSKLWVVCEAVLHADVEKWQVGTLHQLGSLTES